MKTLLWVVWIWLHLLLDALELLERFSWIFISNWAQIPGSNTIKRQKQLCWLRIWILSLFCFFWGKLQCKEKQPNTPQEKNELTLSLQKANSLNTSTERSTAASLTWESIDQSCRRGRSHRADTNVEVIHLCVGGAIRAARNMQRAVQRQILTQDWELQPRRCCCVEVTASGRINTTENRSACGRLVWSQQLVWDATCCFHENMTRQNILKHPLRRGGGLMNSDLDNNSYLILVGESSHTVRVRSKVLFGNCKYFIYVFNLDWKRRYNDKSTTDQLICHLVQISSPIL